MHNCINFWQDQLAYIVADFQNNERIFVRRQKGELNPDKKKLTNYLRQV